MTLTVKSSVVEDATGSNNEASSGVKILDDTGEFKSVSSSDNSNRKNSINDKSNNLSKCRGEAVDPKNLEVGTGTSGTGAGVTHPKIQDVKTSINKIIHQSHSPKDGHGEPSAKEIQCELGDQIRTMKRSDLETLIVDRIIEEIAMYSSVGVLNEKLRHANSHKDRLFQRISNLQRQVTELAKVVRSVAENVGRNQKTVRRANLPIRFYRSVGVQVLLDDSAFNPPPQPQPRSSSGPQFSKPTTVQPKKYVLTSGNNNMSSSLRPQFQSRQVQNHSFPTKPIPDHASLTPDLNGNGHLRLKRTMLKPSVRVAEAGTQKVEIQNSKVRKVGSPVPSVSSTPPKIKSANTADLAPISFTKNLTRSSPAIQQEQQQQRNNNTVKSNPGPAGAERLNGSSPILDVQGGSYAVSIPKTGNGIIEPGIIDLTNDGDAVVTSLTTPEKKTEPPATATATAPTSSIPITNKKNTGNSVVLTQNGVQYCLVSQGPQHQLAKNSGNYRVVTSGNQTWPVFVSAAGGVPQIGAQLKRPEAAEKNPLLGTLVLIPGNQQIAGGPIRISTGGKIMTRPFAPAVQQQTKNDCISPMVKKQMSQQQGQPINTASMVPKQQKQQQQGATQINANKVVTNYPSELQTLCPMDQAPRASATTVADVVKKFVMPPLPPPAINGNPRRCSKDIPPRPDLSVTEGTEGIVLSWTSKQLGPNHAEIDTYQIYACEEPLNHSKSGSWKRVGDVKSLPLPMACTLSQFTDANRYHFIVRGVDVFNRTGPFSKAAPITLTNRSSGQDC